MNLIEEEFTAITFSELKHLSDVDLPQCVSKEGALKICKSSLAFQEANGNEIFHLWVHKLIKVFDGINFSAAEWQSVTDFFLDIIHQLTECTSIDINESLQEKIAAVLYDAMELLKWFHSSFADRSIRICCIILSFILQTVLKCLEFNKKSNIKNGKSKLMQDALLLHNFVLQIINQSANLLKVTDAEEFSKLYELIQTLCVCCEQSSVTEVKSIVETWKCITKLTILCAKFCNDANNENANIPHLWATRPLQFLIKEIYRNLKIVIREDTLQQPIEQIEKYLRVTNFYLKLLLRLTADFSHENFPCAEEFVETFLVLKTATNCFPNVEFKSIVEKYLEQELDQILRMVFKHEDFSKALLSEKIRKDPHTFFCFSKEFLNIVITEKDVTFINYNIHAFIQNFVHLCKDPHNFCKKKIYNNIIEQYAALAVLNSNNELKNYFKLSVNNSNFILAQTSVDILLSISWSAFTSHMELLQDFHYWQQCNEKYSIFTSNPSELHVQKLLLNYFHLCKSSKQITHAELIENEIKMPFSKFNYRFLSTMCLKRIFKHEVTLHAITVEISNELVELFKKLETNNDVEAYYKMTFYIKLLSTCADSPPSILLESISDLTYWIVKKPINEMKTFSRLIETIMDYIIINQKDISENLFSQMFKTLAEHACNLSSEIYVLFFSFLNIALENVSLKQSAKSLLLKMNANPNSKLLEYLYIINRRGKLKSFGNCENNLNIYKNIKIIDLPKHNCTTQFKTKSAKRSRIQDNSNTKLILSEMFHESEELVKLSSKIDKFDICVIDNIITNLQNLKLKNKTEVE